MNRLFSETYQSHGVIIPDVTRANHKCSPASTIPAIVIVVIVVTSVIVAIPCVVGILVQLRAVLLEVILASTLEAALSITYCCCCFGNGALQSLAMCPTSSHL